jgi:hypothetical protein
MASNAAAKFINNAVLNDAQIRFRNFSGAPGQYNAAGQRNFCVLLPEDVANAMAADGWNVKYLKPREEGDLPQAYIKVKINFNGPRPPKVHMVTSRGRRQLDESMLDILDWADFAKVDLIISPYRYDVNGNQGISAYLQTIFVTIREDELELQYADVPEIESAQNVLVWQESSPEEIEAIKIHELEA